MPSSPLFKERQRFRQYDLLALLSVLLAAAAYLSIAEVISATSTSLLKLGVLVGIAAVLAARIIYLLRARLKVTVTARKLKVRVKSALRPARAHIPLQEIESCEVVHHPHFAQRYGRSGWLNGERFLSLVGRNGLAIRTRDGRKYFVGSQRPEQLLEAVQCAV